jgi:hypothetical protein
VRKIQKLRLTDGINRQNSENVCNGKERKEKGTDSHSNMPSEEQFMSLCGPVRMYAERIRFVRNIYIFQEARK